MLIASDQKLQKFFLSAPKGGKIRFLPVYDWHTFFYIFQKEICLYRNQSMLNPIENYF